MVLLEVAHDEIHGFNCVLVEDSQIRQLARVKYGKIINRCPIRDGSFVFLGNDGMWRERACPRRKYRSARLLSVNRFQSLKALPGTA